MVNYEEEYFTGKGYIEYRDFPDHAKRVDKIIAMSHPTSVLDCGCAYGYVVKRLLDKGVFAVGIDISHWCEKQAKFIIPNNFIRHDIREPLPFMDKQFDVLYCEGVLEHIEEEHIPNIMREFERVALERILQISLIEHKNAADAPGHVCLHDHLWWLERIPDYTWLLLNDCGSQDGKAWLYKA